MGRPFAERRGPRAGAVWKSPRRPVESPPVPERDEDLCRTLKLRVDEEHRVVVIGTPDGLEAMTDAEIVALWRSASRLRAEYAAAGYVVTRESEHPRWSGASRSNVE